jgi:3',5'-cyclic AMP phosphodiesterase CpdA
LNLRLNRGKKHDPQLLNVVMEDLKRQAVDHVVVTGDLTNLSLKSEFLEALSLLERLEMPASEVSIVPGNHDRYTPEAERRQDFERVLHRYLRNENLDGTVNDAGYPYVKLRGQIAIVGLSTSVARPPFVAAGEVGQAQLEALRAILSDSRVRQRTLVVLTHHPVVMQTNAIKRYLQGLRDARALVKVCRMDRPVLFLHGHLHRRICVDIGNGQLSVGAPSGSLRDKRPERMAGYNIYEFADSGEILALRTRTVNMSIGGMAEQRLEMKRAELT